MTTTAVTVPDIGDFDGIPVIEILVSPGERVEPEQALVTLESDKATMDVPAPQAGVIVAIEVALGDLVSEGSVLLTLDVEASDAQVADAPPANAPEAPSPAPSPALAPAVNAPVPASAKMPPAAPTLAQQSGKSVHASPAIRRFARTLGVELNSVTGTGLKGRIVQADVERYVKARLTAPAAAPSGAGDAAGIPPVPEVDFSKFGPVRMEPLSRIKRISGPFLRRAWLNIPHVTYHDEADVTELEAFRAQLKEDADARDVRITPLVFFVKALCSALAKFPGFNASLSADGQQLIFKQYCHIGVAVDTPNGLVVPVIRDADSKGIIALATELADLSSRAREGRLKGDEMQGGSMSISSLGGIGGTGFTPIVNAPEVAILGVARSRMVPVWDGERFAPRLMLPLSLSFDHRVVDGAEGARFMNHLCAQLKDVRKLLL